MRIGFGLALMIVVVGCTPKREDGQSTVDAYEDNTNCTGLACQIVDCEKMGTPPTTVSGTAYAPNGTLALYGATVYIPDVDPGPFHEGVECTQCMDQLPGGSIAQTTSDIAGKFQLTNVPSGTDVPLFVTIGKWRRKVTIPSVTPCTDNPLPAEITSLPKNKSEGDIPKIAITTGSADAIECLLRKLGVSDSEFTPAGGTGRINLYASNGANKLANNMPFLPAAMLWSDIDRMKQYDMMMFSCEGSEYPDQKPQAYMDNLKAYADMGGRVFLEHYHNVWIDGEDGVETHAPSVWPGVATCNLDGYDSGTGVIDEVNNPKGNAFSQWMMAVGGSTTPGTVTIADSRQSCSAINNEMAERWVYMKIGGIDYPQNFQFTTPLEAAKEERCGKVVFSDMHVASGSTSSSSTPFPMGCSSAAMTPQEKALSFMLFDIATCVGPIL